MGFHIVCLTADHTVHNSFVTLIYVRQFFPHVRYTFLVDMFLWENMENIALGVDQFRSHDGAFIKTHLFVAFDAFGCFTLWNINTLPNRPN